MARIPPRYVLDGVLSISVSLDRPLCSLINYPLFIYFLGLHLGVFIIVRDQPGLLTLDIKAL